MSSYARGFTNGLALGAGLMFLLDPRQGGARRALVRDKALRAAHELEDAAKIGARDLAHRVEGAAARTLTPREDHVAGDVLVARVRARLGHVCAHAGAIEVVAKDAGCVELKGHVLEEERPKVLSAVSRVPGVRKIDDDLTVHADASDVPGLTVEPRAPRPPLARVFTPATRLVVGTGAAALALGSLVRGHPVGFIVGGASLLAIARTMAHRELRWPAAGRSARVNDASNAKRASSPPEAPPGAPSDADTELPRAELGERDVPTVP